MKALEQVRDELTGLKYYHARAVLEQSFEAFCRWVFPDIEGVDIIWEAPQREKAKALEGVTFGRHRLLIINEAPRYSKTLLTSILWPAWNLARDPSCRFMNISFSDKLALENSSMVRHVITSPRFQYFWPAVQTLKDTTAKDYWKTTAGGMYRAVSSGGQVTGFGGGRLKADRFAGAVIIDDPLKPDDARKPLVMETVNQRYNTTFKHRRNDKKTPIVINAQRLSNGDFSGYLLNGGSGERWDHLRLPAMVNDETRTSDRYTEDWKFGDPIPISDDIPDGPLWADKIDEAEAAIMIAATPGNWNTQYLQNPGKDEDKFFSTSWFPRWTRVQLKRGPTAKVWVTSDPTDDGIEIHDLRIFSDTAMKKGEANDYSVFQLWGRGRDRRIYILDQIRDKWEAPELLIEARGFLEKHRATKTKKIGWRTVHIEDKASGIGLIQQLTREYYSKVIPIPRETDKVSRAYANVKHILEGKVVIPASAPWVPGYLSEFHAFSKHMTHKQDDQIDPTLDACEELLADNYNDYSWA